MIAYRTIEHPPVCVYRKEGRQAFYEIWFKHILLTLLLLHVLLSVWESLQSNFADIAILHTYSTGKYLFQHLTVSRLSSPIRIIRFVLVQWLIYFYLCATMRTMIQVLVSVLSIILIPYEIYIPATLWATRHVRQWFIFMCHKLSILILPLHILLKQPRKLIA